VIIHLDLLAARRSTNVSCEFRLGRIEAASQKSILSASPDVPADFKRIGIGAEILSIAAEFNCVQGHQCETTKSVGWSLMTLRAELQIDDHGIN
jgi:hypothetical protein